LTDKGLHPSVRVTDLIVAAVAEHLGASVVHYDDDFDGIARDRTTCGMGGADR